MLLADKVDEQCHCKLITCASEISQDSAKWVGWNYEDTESIIERGQQNQGCMRYQCPSCIDSILSLISLHHGTASGCKMDSFGIEYSQRLAQEFSWHAATAVGYSFHAAGHALVLGQDETQWNIKLRICLNCCAEVLARTRVAPGWQTALCGGVKRLNQSSVMNTDVMVLEYGHCGNCEKHDVNVR